MKHLLMLLGAIACLCLPTSSEAISCEQSMFKADYKGQFIMLDDHTILILPSDSFK